MTAALDRDEPAATGAGQLLALRVCPDRVVSAVDYEHGTPHVANASQDVVALPDPRRELGQDQGFGIRLEAPANRVVGRLRRVGLGEALAEEELEEAAVVAEPVVAVVLRPALVGVELELQSNVLKTDRRARLFWSFMGLGLVSWWAYRLIWAYIEVVQRREVPDPFTGDAILFLHFVPMMAALALIKRYKADVPSRVKCYAAGEHVPAGSPEGVKVEAPALRDDERLHDHRHDPEAGLARTRHADDSSSRRRPEAESIDDGSGARKAVRGRPGAGRVRHLGADPGPAGGGRAASTRRSGRGRNWA